MSIISWAQGLQNCNNYGTKIDNIYHARDLHMIHYQQNADLSSINAFSGEGTGNNICACTLFVLGVVHLIDEV